MLMNSVSRSDRSRKSKPIIQFKVLRATPSLQFGLDWNMIKMHVSYFKYSSFLISMDISDRITKFVDPRLSKTLVAIDIGFKKPMLTQYNIQE